MTTCDDNETVVDILRRCKPEWIEEMPMYVAAHRASGKAFEIRYCYAREQRQAFFFTYSQDSEWFAYVWGAENEEDFEAMAALLIRSLRIKFQQIGVKVTSKGPEKMEDKP